MQKSYNIIETKHHGNILALPHFSMSELKLRNDQQVTLKCGSARVTVRIKELNASNLNNKNMLGLSPDTLKKVEVPTNIQMQIKPIRNNTFQLGPVIGILTFYSHVPARLGFYRNYDRTKNDIGLLYVFRGQDIHPKTETISGYYYNNKENKWEAGEFPYPDAVYDRCYPNGPMSHKRLEKVIGTGKIFNKKSMLTKLDFATALKKSKLLKNHIPKTQLLKNSSDLDRFLEKYNEVYFKPVNGMEGFGIVLVKKTIDGSIECTYNIKGKYFTHKIPSADEIFNVLNDAAGRHRPYIIQQGINRMDYQGGTFSLRSWAMKNGKGKWIMPGIFAKGTFGKGFLTNYMAGAKLIPLPELFSNILPRMPYKKNQLLDIIENLTIQTATVLDKSYGPLGELGLDIVFDTKGKPWLIEANGNPGNIPIFQQRDYPLWPYLSFAYPIEYAKYLAGFSDKV